MYCSYTTQTSCSTSFLEKTLLYKWIIANAERNLHTEKLRSPKFELSSVGDCYLRLEWVQKNIKVELHLPNIICLVSDIEFSTTNCLSKRVVQAENFKTSQRSHSCIGIISIPDNERFDNYLHDGILTVEVRATITLIENPVQLVTKALALPDNSFREKIYEMFKEEAFTDITIIAGGKSFKAHKVVLGSQSDVFKRMLEADMKEKKESIVELPDMTSEVMEDLLAYFYTGSPANLKTLAKELLVAADKYNIQHLQVMCENELKMNLTCENVTPILLLVDKLQQKTDASLKEASINFIKQHSELVYKSSSWVESVDVISKDILLELATKSLKI